MILVFHKILQQTTQSDKFTLVKSQTREKKNPKPNNSTICWYDMAVIFLYQVLQQKGIKIHSIINFASVLYLRYCTECLGCNCTKPKCLDSLEEDPIFLPFFAQFPSLAQWVDTCKPPTLWSVLFLMSSVLAIELPKLLSINNVVLVHCFRMNPGQDTYKNPKT